MDHGAIALVIVLVLVGLGVAAGLLSLTLSWLLSSSGGNPFR